MKSFFSRPKKPFRFLPDTLMFRTTMLYVLSLLGVIVWIGLFIMGTVSHTVIQDTRRELTAVELKLIDTLETPADKQYQDILDEMLYPDHANYYVQVIEASGRVLAQSRGWYEAYDTDQQEVKLNWVVDTLKWNAKSGLFFRDQLVWNPLGGGEGTIHIRVQLNNVERLLQIMVQVLFITGLISSTVGSLLIYHVTQRNLSPLFAITNAVRRIQDHPDLKHRIPLPDTPRELNDLARTLNHMLVQLGEQVDREKNFVSDASHELRTPLTAFRGYVKLLKRWGTSNPDVLNRSLEALDQESQRMQRLIAQLLTLARTGSITPSRERIDLSDTIHQAIHQLWTEDRGITLRVNLDKDAYVLGDGDQLRQVAIILIENAIRYTNPGGWIRVEVARNKESVCFSVADSGIGIPADEIGNVFDRFYRVDKARSRATGGTGLGLSIAKQLVNNHQGSIEVDSRLGEGSTFKVCLPPAPQQRH
ncbi:histidine kinase [Paenibacillus dendritiformis]|uniref:sensor histidine kinase n=1 Tax=Paenibacillus dendritiformis TaxID=130049 RepID=UPI0018CF8DBC|nr:ATP-binding protein [Paenibacillus dendritiformis]MBG9791985.1 histidine kinase [Paenibacillus dendritiformis]